MGPIIGHSDTRTTWNAANTPVGPTARLPQMSSLAHVVDTMEKENTKVAFVSQISVQKHQ